ncbi:MAG TPA: hypothetical protein VFK05_28690 [Polyangiaceae bacterium]|nr:hypothetical protein [Polyangiaceae bacterium]
MILELILGSAIAFGIGSRIYFMRAREDVFRGPNLYARIDALFEPYAGQQLSPEIVAHLEAEADTLFRDIVTGVGLVPNHWRLLVHVDDVLGPVPRLRGPNGQLLDVADFEQRLRDGRINLSSD